jgi:ATP synthase protein I
MNLPKGPRGPGGSSQSWSRSATPFLTLGVELAVGIALFFFIGRWLDEKWGTSPWLMVSGLVMGTVGGLIRFFRIAMAIGKNEEMEGKHRNGKL